MTQKKYIKKYWGVYSLLIFYIFLIWFILNFVPDKKENVIQNNTMQVYNWSSFNYSETNYSTEGYIQVKPDTKFIYFECIDNSILIITNTTIECVKK